MCSRGIISNIFLVGFLFAFIYLSASHSFGQASQEVETGNLYHWAYAATLGTGYYSIGVDKVFVFRIYPKVPLAATEDNKLSFDLRLPLTIGVQVSDLDKILDDYIPDRFQTISFVPGISLQSDVNPSWTLRPYFHMGLGAEIHGNDSAVIYYVGLNSRYRFEYGKSDFALLNAIQTQGYTPNHGEKDSFSRLVTGLEWDYPLGDKTFKDEQLYIRPHFAHYWYFDNLKFLYVNGEPVFEIKQEFELGLSFGTKEKVSLWLFSFDRIGLAYFLSEDIEGIRFVVGSIF